MNAQHATFGGSLAAVIIGAVLAWMNRGAVTGTAPTATAPVTSEAAPTVTMLRVGTSTVLTIKIPGGIEPMPNPVTPPPPKPEPTPAPKPTPPAPPAPVPLPQPKLHAIFVYESGCNGKACKAVADLNQSPGFAKSMTGLNVAWQVLASCDPEVDTLKMRPYVGAFGRLPLVVIYDEAGHVYDGAGVSKVNTAIDPPVGVVDTIQLFGKLRGH